MQPNLTHYKKFLHANGYKVPDNDYDVVHIARALMKVKFPRGWSDHFIASGGVLLSGVEQNKGESDE